MSYILHFMFFLFGYALKCNEFALISCMIDFFAISTLQKCKQVTGTIFRHNNTCTALMVFLAIGGDSQPQTFYSRTFTRVSQVPPPGGPGGVCLLGGFQIKNPEEEDYTD